MDKEKIYKYHLRKRTLYTSVLYIVLFVALSITFAIIYKGGYISAWFISLMLAVLALMTLSIPRRVVVDEEGIEIQCITEDTTFAYDEIFSIRKVDMRKMNACIPIFAAIGFFGYYGRFLNLRTMDFIHIYASYLDNFVEITDIEGDKYYISCDEADDLIARVEEYMKHLDTQENI